MPAVVRMGEQLFMDDFFEDMESSPINNQLLSTIRVPKNLLYLTDRLPQPRYGDVRNRNRTVDEAEDSQRKTVQDTSDQ